VLFAGFVPYVLNMHTRVKMEESHLSERLGDEYRRYLERVPRYVPGFRGSSHPARGAQG
jgi:protein-S-isoprenylcysteine O-methyltransferase Ste14